MSASLFENMAPNAQRSMLFTFGLGAVAAVIYMFCIQTGEMDLARAKQDLSALQDQQRATERDLRGAGQLKARLEEIKSGRQRYLDALITPLLESYAMRAKSVLDPLAADVGLTISDYAELDARALPLPKPQPQQLYARRPIRVTCTGSYAVIASFILRVEKMLPLVSVQAFTIKAQTGNDAQVAEIVFEWPVKGVTVAPKGGAKK